MKEVNNNKEEEIKLLKDLFDKKIEIERLKQKRTPIWKIITYIFVGLAAVSFLAFSCYMMYKQSFTMETLLTVLLSFFSIGLSIMFYVQSERSSSSYYAKSYEIMKDVSVALGKIESGFGEKLTDIKANLDKMEHKKAEMENKLEEKVEEQKDLADKIAKEKSEEQRINLVKDLQEKTREIEDLKHQLITMENRRTHILQENIEMRAKVHNQERVINDLLKKNRSNERFTSARKIFDFENDL